MPVRVRQRPQGPPPGAGEIPSAPMGGAREPAPRALVAPSDTAKTTVTPKSAGIAHIILEVTDNGTPPLTSYRRVILEVGQ